MLHPNRRLFLWTLLSLSFGFVNCLVELDPVGIDESPPQLRDVETSYQLLNVDVGMGSRSIPPASPYTGRYDMVHSFPALMAEDGRLALAVSEQVTTTGLGDLTIQVVNLEDGRSQETFSLLTVDELLDPSQTPTDLSLRANDALDVFGLRESTPLEEVAVVDVSVHETAGSEEQWVLETDETTRAMTLFIDETAVFTHAIPRPDETTVCQDSDGSIERAWIASNESVLVIRATYELGDECLWESNVHDYVFTADAEGWHQTEVSTTSDRPSGIVTSVVDENAESLLLPENSFLPNTMGIEQNTTEGNGSSLSPSRPNTVSLAELLTEPTRWVCNDHPDCHPLSRRAFGDCVCDSRGFRVLVEEHDLDDDGRADLFVTWAHGEYQPANETDGYDTAIGPTGSIFYWRAPTVRSGDDRFSANVADDRTVLIDHEMSQMAVLHRDVEEGHWCRPFDQLAVFSRDNRWLAIGTANDGGSCTNHTVRLVDTATLETRYLAPLEYHPTEEYLWTSVGAFSPDGLYLAVVVTSSHGDCMWDARFREVLVWDLRTGELNRSVDYSMEAEEGYDDTDTVQLMWAEDYSSEGN